MSTDPATLLTYGVHLGHKKNKIHPKANRYIHTIDKGVSIIDLFQTAECLDAAKKFVADLAKEQKTLMVVATKRGAREIVSELCNENALPHMTNKWVGGMLTNLDQVLKNISNMNRMREDEEQGAWNDMIKHERNALHKKLHRIETIYGGVSTITKLPDALFIIDIKKERNAMIEAQQMGIPIVALVDTNVDPTHIQYPIPANDDAVLSIKFMAEEIINEYAKNRKSEEKKPEKIIKKVNI